MSVTKNLNTWKKSFIQHGVKDELVADYITYIKPLLKNEVPIIFDFNHLCLLLGKNKAYLASAVNASVLHYREFEIKKRSGGKRIISAPYPALLDCQRWIHQNILSKVTIHPSAHGFTHKKSIITNAKHHLQKNHFLKIDIKNFFPTITINQVITVFKNLGYTHKISFYLASLCCYENVLPQGAPTSPMLSNIIAKSMDDRLKRFAEKFDLSYTRYADDLAFSGNSISIKHYDYISKIIQECGFTVNSQKTILQQKKAKRVITGISIAEDQIKLPREYKRKLKVEIHCIRKHGIVAHIRNQRIKNPNYLSTIIGRIQFWLSVEPNNDFAKKALQDLKPILS